MANLWNLGDLTFWQLLKRVGKEVVEDKVFGQSAKLSYYFLLALFPLLLLLSTIFGYFAQSVELKSALLDYFQRVAPVSAFRLVSSTLNQITQGASAGKLSLGIIGTLFAASGGMRAITDGLNTAYGVKDERPVWKSYLLSVGLTVAFALFTLASLMIILLGPRVAAVIGEYAGFPDTFHLAWAILRWPLAFVIVLIAIDLLYRFAPDLRKWKLAWFTPGSIVAVGLWVLLSSGFRLYLRHFNRYTRTYGSLGAVIILMFWLYFTGAAILIGAEVNSEIESAQARVGAKDARMRGEKEPGERAALREKPRV